MIGKDLTVVIPNYNKAKFIEQCVMSIEEQSVKPAEIIIVDDFSTDTSKRLIDSLSKRYMNVHPYYAGKNMGVSAARNKGLSLVSTDYVTFIDADDYYFNKDKLKNEIRLINEHGEDTIAYSVTAVLKGNGGFTDTRIKRNKYYLNGNVRFSLLTMRKWDSVMRDYIVRTDTLRSVGGYDESHSLFEDYELLLKLSKKVKFYCTGQYGTGYREGNGISKRSRRDHDRIREEMIRRELEKDNIFFRLGVVSEGTIQKIKRKTKDLLRKILKKG